MRILKLLMPLSISVLIACTAHGQNFDVLIQNCPDFQYQQYTVSPYITAAIQLQSMGRDSAITAMRKCCETDGTNNKVIILCRMLFESNETMRRPLIGGAVFTGNTAYSHWPTEPITIVQGIPFLIVRGYFIGGLPEPAIDYLEYCEQHCTWRNETYSIPTDSTLSGAVNELLNSDVWHTPLTAEEKHFFISQISM